jgi:hypothetical protein
MKHKSKLKEKIVDLINEFKDIKILSEVLAT